MDIAVAVLTLPSSATWQAAELVALLKAEGAWDESKHGAAVIATGWLTGEGQGAQHKRNTPLTLAAWRTCFVQMRMP